MWSALRGQRWTLLMIIFMLGAYLAVYLSQSTEAETTIKKDPSAQKQKNIQMMKDREKVILKKLESEPLLSVVLSLTFTALFFWGLFLDLVWAKKRWRRVEWVVLPRPMPSVGWLPADVLQVLVFLFFTETVLFLMHWVGGAFGWNYWSHDHLLLIHSVVRSLVVALFVLVMIRVRFDQGPRELGLSTENFWLRVRTGLTGYLAVIPPMILVFVLIGVLMKLFAYEPEPQDVVQIYLKKTSEPFLLVFTFFVAILGPILEEFFFRGFAYASLRRKWGAWPAAVLSSAVFAAFHLNAVAFVPIFLLGLFLTYLYQATGSLVTPIAAHMVHNTLMVCLTLGFKSLSLS